MREIAEGVATRSGLDESEAHQATAETIPADAKITAPGELPTGTLVDRYEIEGRIGSGSMGVVYLARDTRLGPRVAVKLLRAQPDSELFRELCQRLVREAMPPASSTGTSSRTTC